ncbi:chemotaxis-specific protein-glutamate methyltransferase [Hyphomicrobium denitrificans 1NES1]|uniref:Protein-glutamate methylesterase/protein-glutamine glutaminase n=1 Tax=Hyphomicrobium denitrificans 1NES1 TaxID=670307 RepID=N0BGU9_9HYPH|nr:chemotaxis response regulator protein-glutamate methylesterase [Hyphomicrobium denitrificans]AGK59370.1 chemotaxis-specific protein-glutamate methyltransferase [Hyphomicrobium denitrificans 1NES1]
MKKIKVLVVDDSSTMRGLIATALSSDADIEVVGQAEDPLQARQAIKALNPDVVTLDVEMPNMSGLEFLEKIMRLRPMPVIMVSTLTSRGADETVRALEIGAVDCIEKPRPGNEHNFEELPFKVKIAAAARIRPLTTESDRQKVATEARAAHAHYAPDGRVLAIGASTGGVEALIELLSHFPENCPPTVIAQHMPASFTKSFANRLDRICPAKVQEASTGAKLAPGHIFLAPGGALHLELSGAGDMHCRLRPGDRVNGHCPSVDVLFESVARTCGARAVGLILTGMGRDGASGLLSMRKAGARTFGQNESSCIVYGMPKAAFDLGAVEKQLPLDRLAAAIMSETSTIKKH